MKGLMLGLALALSITPALAARHPVQEVTTSIDVAARPTYPIEIIAPLRKGWRHQHNVERKVRPHKSGPIKSVSNKKWPRRQGGGANLAEATKAATEIVSLTLGAMRGLENFADGIAGFEPKVITRRPYRLQGTVDVAGQTFDYVSGGAGWSIPYGDWKIDDSAGRWGSRHGALGLNDDSMPDRYLGRERVGIEIHENYDGRTAGCFGVGQYGAFKKAVLAMIHDFGVAYLHVRPEGAMVTPIKGGDPFVMLADTNDEHRQRIEHRHEYHYAHHHRHNHYASR